MIPILGKPIPNVDYVTIGDWWNEYQKNDPLRRMCPPVLVTFKEECEAVGVDYLILFSQFCLETGFGKSELYRKKLNMFGLGAVDSDPNGQGASFRSFREAIRAGAQHLAVYAGSPKIQSLKKEDFILERTHKLKAWGYFGIVKELTELGGADLDGKIKWASDPDYGIKLLKLYESNVAFALKENSNPKPPLLPPEPITLPIPPMPKPIETAPKKPSKPIIPPGSDLGKIIGKIPWWLRLSLKTGIKYGTPFVLGLLAAVSEPWKSILTAIWHAVEKGITTLF